MRAVDTRIHKSSQIIGLSILAVVEVPLPLRDTGLDGSPAVDAVGHGCHVRQNRPRECEVGHTTGN
jgi:hypothetical protein